MIVKTQEMKMVAFNFERIGVEPKPEQLEIIERVYYNRVREQKNQNIYYTIFHICLALIGFMIIVLFCALDFSWWVYLGINVLYLVSHIFALVVKLKALKQYKKDYEPRYIPKQ